MTQVYEHKFDCQCNDCQYVNSLFDKMFTTPPKDDDAEPKLVTPE